jgi:hypothetical protein
MGGGNLLRGFPDVLGPCLRLRVERFFKAVVTQAILELCSNLFVRRPNSEAMQNVCGGLNQGGD